MGYFRLGLSLQALEKGEKLLWKYEKKTATCDISFDQIFFKVEYEEHILKPWREAFSERSVDIIVLTCEGQFYFEMDKQSLINYRVAAHRIL